MMTIHLLIVDALNLIRRIHAVQGSPCRALRRRAATTIRPYPSDSRRGGFDDELRREGWRHQLLPDYKAGRPPMPEDLQLEMPQIRAAFRQAGVACWTAEGDEADDLAATLAVKVAQSGHQATIVSTDKGYCQLLAPTIRIRDYFQKRWLDQPFIDAEFGVAPAQLPDYWGPAGISSSKIPGVAGIGPKAPASCCNSSARWKRSFSSLMRCRINGVRNWLNNGSWLYQPTRRYATHRSSA